MNAILIGEVEAPVDFAVVALDEFDELQEARSAAVQAVAASAATADLRRT